VLYLLAANGHGWLLPWREWPYYSRAISSAERGVVFQGM
jgi:hypothetical protein